MRLIFLISAAFLSLPLLSMPTAAELEKVKPLVQDLMKSDLDAMKLGKKSRADVAKSSMSLYPQAESQAAKLLLARSAFNLYVKAGEYEAAEKALDALLSAVPDYPALEQAELLEKALYPVPYKSAPNLRARLAAIKEKAQAAGQLKSLLSGFDALAEGPKHKAAATRIAISYVSLGDWPNAVKYFALSDSPAASAAQEELKLAGEPEATRSYDKAANDWWSIELPKRDSKLALSFRAHAADLYSKVLPTLTGLAKVQADRRIKEYEAELAAATTISAASIASNAKSARSYVQKGLIAQWDGIENAGYGKHLVPVEEWVDLRGGRNVKLNQSATFSDDALICDGKSYAGSMKSSIPSSKIVAAEVVFEIVSIHGNSCLFSTGTHTAFYDRCFGVIGGGSKLVFANYVIGDVQKGRHSCHLRFGSGEFFVDGIRGVSSAKGTLDAVPKRGEEFYVGGFLNSAVGCKINSIRFYDRKLTDDEIKKNYLTDKERFKL